MNSTTTQNTPRALRMLTIREVAATGLLPEHTLRTLVKDGQAPCITVGNRVYINFDKLVAQLAAL